MNFCSVLLSLFICVSFESRLQEKLVQDFVDTFNNSLVLKSWSFLKYSKKSKNKDGKKILEDVISNIKDLLVKSRSDEYKSLKRLINDTQTESFDNASFFHFETFVIVRSLQRIFKITDNCQDVQESDTKEKMTKIHKKMINLTDDKLKYPTHHNYKQFNQKVILFEYACIYNDIMCIFKIISKKYIEQNVLNFFYAGYFPYENFFIRKLFENKIKYLIKYSRYLVERILRADIYFPIYVLTSICGITNTLKCSQTTIKAYSLNGYKKIVISDEVRDFDKENIKRNVEKQPNIDYILDKFLIIDITSMELFVMLIHFHSIQNEVEYMYKFSRGENGLYKVKCIKYDVKLQLKSYYLKKNMPECCSIKTRPKFGFIKDYEKEYSIKKSDDTVDEPINTRVIKLSCGHLLGLELIDDWFEMFPDFKCHICMIDVFIIGSYDTDVYRCI